MKKILIILGALAAAACILLLSAVLVLRNVIQKNKQQSISSESERVSEEVISETLPEEIPEESDSENFEEIFTSEITDEVEEVVIPDHYELLSASNVGENATVTYGIDVSQYQGTIDWAKVAAAGIQFAMIRVGYRGSQYGSIGEDPTARYNLQEAERNGVKIGVYFFSTAISEEEARQDADWVADYISQYSVTYPVAFDCEGFEKESNRQFNLTQEERSNIAMAFMDRVFERGYTPIIYGASKALLNDAQWDTSRIEKKYKIWMAWYNQDTSNLEQKPDYDGQCSMWQYSNTGRVDGINAQVDLDVAYFGYNGTEKPKDTSAREEVTVAAPEPAPVQSTPEDTSGFKTKFTPCNEKVTAKELVNLRSKPSVTDPDSLILDTLTAGQIAVRTGINTDVGWSRVEYNGQVLYCVSSYIYVVE